VSIASIPLFPCLNSSYKDRPILTVNKYGDAYMRANFVGFRKANLTTSLKVETDKEETTDGGRLTEEDMKGRKKNKRMIKICLRV